VQQEEHGEGAGPELVAGGEQQSAEPGVLPGELLGEEPLLPLPDDDLAQRLGGAAQGLGLVRAPQQGQLSLQLMVAFLQPRHLLLQPLYPLPVGQKGLLQPPQHPRPLFLPLGQFHILPINSNPAR
jgi:hypothetical protein